MSHTVVSYIYKGFLQNTCLKIQIFRKYFTESLKTDQISILFYLVVDLLNSESFYECYTFITE